MSDEVLSMVIVFTLVFGIVWSLSVSWRKNSSVAVGLLRLLLYAAAAILLPIIVASI